ncbi:MAG: ABC transporter permease [Burkholderiales bacterium]|nr:ABC transporter permease [Burkholderiales bacterium]
MTALRDRFGDEAVAFALRLLLIAAVGVALAVFTEGFLSAANILNVLRQASLIFLLASGLTLVLLAGGFDLSVASNLTLAACLAAGVMQATGSPTFGALTALGCSTVAGIANGLAVTLLRLPPFLATYGTLWILQGLAFQYMGGNEIYGFPAGFRQLGTGFLWGVPVPVYLMAMVLVLGTLLTRKLNIGYEIYAIGANPVAARLSGIPVRRRQLLVYTLSGLMAGVAALVYLARVNSADSGIGEPLLLPVIAAILIGGTSLFGGVGSLLGTVAGAIILSLVINGMNLLNVRSTWQPLVVGAVLLVAVLADLASRGRRERIG